MKVNKKVVLSTAAFLGVAGLVAGGTIAYFTDKTLAAKALLALFLPIRTIATGMPTQTIAVSTATLV